MEFTDVIQKCYSVNPTPDTVAFRIENTVSEKGELPRKDIFVYGVLDTNYPNLDKFLRVASLAELQSLPNDRAKAIRDGGTVYLDEYAEMQYDDLETAVAAKSVLSGRINDLVNAWLMYIEQFYADDVSQLYPTASSSILQASKDAYSEAKEKRISAESDLVAAKQAEDDATEALSLSEQILGIYQEEKTFCTEVLNGIYPAYISMLGSTEPSTAQAYRTGTLEPRFLSFCSNATTKVITWSNTVASNKKDLSDATANKIKAEAELEMAQAAEDKALAAVLELCGDFDPESV